MLGESFAGVTTSGSRPMRLMIAALLVTLAVMVSPATATAAASVHTAPANGTVIATLKIPRFGADYAEPIGEGIGERDVLNSMIGHFPETAMPGAPGQSAPAAAHAAPARAAASAEPVNGAQVNATPVNETPASGAPVNAASAALRRRAGATSGGSGTASESTGRSRPGTVRRDTGTADEPWPDEPSDPFNDAPESNAWETAEAPADIYSGGHLSDSEWAGTNWAGTGSTTRPNGSAPAAPAATAQSAVPAATAAPDAGHGAAQGHGTPAAAPSAPSQAAKTAPAAPAQAAGTPNQPLSRYQKLLNEAAQRGGGAPVRGSRPVDYVEDVPSADDITLEDSGLVGRKAIERILGGRLIEERSLDGR